MTVGFDAVFATSLSRRRSGISVDGSVPAFDTASQSSATSPRAT